MFGRKKDKEPPQTSEERFRAALEAIGLPPDLDFEQAKAYQSSAKTYERTVDGVSITYTQKTVNGSTACFKVENGEESPVSEAEFEEFREQVGGRPARERPGARADSPSPPKSAGRQSLTLRCPSCGAKNKIEAGEWDYCSRCGAQIFGEQK